MLNIKKMSLQLQKKFFSYKMVLRSYFTLLHLDQIFPSVSSVVIFFTYMIVCLQQALLVTASRTENKTYPYNPASVVLLTEAAKFSMAIAFLLNR